MNTIIKQWRDGSLSSDKALALIGKKMATANDRQMLKLQEMINEIIGIPDELPEEGTEHDRENWERYHNG